jgi:hypothetical protein
MAKITGVQGTRRVHMAMVPDGVPSFGHVEPWATGSAGSPPATSGRNGVTEQQLQTRHQIELVDADLLEKSCKKVGESDLAYLHSGYYSTFYL